MKKIALLLALAMATSFITHSQQFKKSTGALNVGIGLGSGLYSGHHYKMSIPPIILAYDHGITEKLGIGYISLGGYFAISGSKWEYDDGFYNYGWKYTYFTVGPRAAYHFDVVDVLDLYAGILVGVNIVSSKSFGDTSMGSYSAQKTGIAHAEFAGIRYYFTPVIGAFAELGYGVTYLTLGVTFKFP
jgi:hypothetical protein